MAEKDDNKPKSWAEKEIQLKDVPSHVQRGNSIYIGSTAATAVATLQVLVDDPRLENMEIIQCLPGGVLPHLQTKVDRFRTSSYYSFSPTSFVSVDDKYSKGVMEGLQDYKPISLSAIPHLLETSQLSVDVAIIKVTPPHKGFVSLGMGVDMTRDFVRHAKLVIAEVNPQMVWTEGHSKLKIGAIDLWVTVNQPLLTTHELWPEYMRKAWYAEDVRNRIGQHVIKEIPDGATLRFGISPIASVVGPFLKQRKDLGLHTDILTEDMYRLHEEGVFTNAHKTIDKGRSIVAQAHGSQELYSFLDRNPILEFRPLSYTCDPQVLAQIDNLIVMVGALKVDLTGQVATDSIAHKFYGGVWSDDDSIRGARYSKGGKPIVLIPSMSLQGRSNVVFALPPGTGVSITRADVEYVVTEYGTAYLFGKSIRERCLAMIGIAHPEYRKGLLAEAKKYHYVSESQPGRSVGALYPSQFECLHTTKQGRKVLVRPIKTIDEDILRTFFHKLSDHSVYFRYFRRLRSMPQLVLQKTADVDYASNMALVALSPPDARNPELVGLAQWVSESRAGSVPEIAFQVRDDWHGEGLGSFLFRRLVDVARESGMKELTAEVLADNTGMNAIFRKASIKFTARSDFGVKSYHFDLSEEEKKETSTDDNLQ